MATPARLSLCLLMLLLALLGRPGNATQPAGRGDPRPRVEVGMSRQQVLALLGPPAHVARQVYYKGIIEQWIYDHAPHRVELHCPFGRESRVRGIYTLPMP